MSTQLRRAAHCGACWILLFYLLAMPLLFRPVLHGVDPVGYFVWLRSAVVDGNLDVANEFVDLKLHETYNYPIVTLPTGYRYNQWSVGPAVLWMPLYGATHLAASGLSAAGVPVATDGYGTPYLVAAALATTMYALAGLLMLFQVARHYAPPRVAVLALITGWFASPLLFYMYSSPLMSHALDFFANALFLFVWWRTRARASETWWPWALRGLCIGLAIVVRIQNVFLVVFPALELAALLFPSPAPFVRRLLGALTAGIALAGGMLLWLGPLMLFWKSVYGDWIYNTYAITNQRDHIVNTWLQPHVLELAFSNDHGLFFWSPVLIGGVVGWFLLLPTDRRMALLLMITAGVQFYFISTLSTWNGGGPSFGARFLVGSEPAYLFGLAVTLTALARRIRFPLLAGICALFVLWNGLLVVQYALGTIPRSGPVDPGELVINQLRVVPDNLARIVQVLAARQGR